MSKTHRGPQDMGAHFQKNKEAPIQSHRKEIGQHQDKSLRESQVKKRQKQQAKKEATKSGQLEYLDEIESNDMGTFKKVIILLSVLSIIIGILYFILTKFGNKQIDGFPNKQK